MPEYPLLPVILASASPRRRDLLRSIGVEARVVPAGIDELPVAGESPADAVRRLAEDKGRAVRQSTGASEPTIVLAADTAVVVDGRMLGKPDDRAEAHAMLSGLSGRTHQVLTGMWVGIAPDGRDHAVTVRTDVTFRALEERWIEAYLQTDEWCDKAGAYGIQERAALFVARIDGSWSNVVGLPLESLADALEKIGVGAEGALGWLSAARR